MTIAIVIAFRYYRSKKADYSEFIEKPEKWSQWETVLNKNSLPCLRIKIENRLPEKPYHSKFGGMPYWPKGKEYPVGKDGKPLYFLAQINFSELPHKLDQYPAEGLLQFFISNDDLFGLDFIDKNNPMEKYLKNKKNFAVIYHPKISPDSPTEEIKLTLKEEEYLPYTGECAVSLNLVQDTASPSDYRFEKITASLGEMDDQTADYAYENLADNPSHKVGGYAFFTQDDPRPYSESKDEWLLLFQIDTDENDKIEIMWGDSGIANFFIRPEDLKNKDFSKVWYNWDCY